MKLRRLSIIAFLLMFGGTQSCLAADIGAVRAFARKGGLRPGIEQGLSVAMRKGGADTEAVKQVLARVNFQAVEEAYVASLAKRLTNPELDALQKAADIPHLQEAQKKQGLAVLDCIEVISKELQEAVSRQGFSGGRK